MIDENANVNTMAKQKQLQLRVSEELHTELTKLATKENTTVTSLVFYALAKQFPSLRDLILRSR